MSFCFVLVFCEFDLSYFAYKYDYIQVSEYSCLWICNIDDTKVIDRICICSKRIFQLESNKHRTKTESQKHPAQRREIKTNIDTTKSQKQTKKN